MFFKLITLVSALVVIFVLVRSFFIKPSVSEELEEKKYYSFFSLILSVFLFLLLFRIQTLPLALNVDEAGGFYDSLNIMRYGIDRYLNRYPSYFINFGRGSSALYNYSASIAFSVFGPGILSFRLPAVIFSLISAVCLATLIKKEKGNRESLIFLAVFIILPFSIMHSRWGLDCFLLFPMLALSSCAFYEAYKSDKKSKLLIAGAMFGLTFYTYAISYIIIFLFVLFLSLYMLWIRRFDLKDLIIFGIPVFLFAIPCLLLIMVNNGMISEIKLPYLTIPKLPAYGGNEISIANLSDNLSLGFIYSIFAYDYLPYNSVLKFGTMYYISLPLILAGFLLCHKKGYEDLKNKTFCVDTLFVMLFWSELITSLLIKHPNVNKMNGLYLPLIYFLFIGISEVYQRTKRGFYIIGALYLFFFGSFVLYYFNEHIDVFEDTHLFISLDDMKKAIDFTEELNRDEIYVLGGEQPYIYVLLASDSDPYDFDQNKVTVDNNVVQYGKYHFVIDDNKYDKDIMLFTKKNEIPEQFVDKGYLEKEFGTVTVYYKNS